MLRKCCMCHQSRLLLSAGLREEAVASGGVSGEIGLPSGPIRLLIEAGGSKSRSHQTSEGATAARIDIVCTYREPCNNIY